MAQEYRVKADAMEAGHRYSVAVAPDSSCPKRRLAQDHSLQWLTLAVLRR
jgi:hypothetical protein